MEVYTGDFDSPTKCQKHYRNSGIAIGAIISGPLLVAEPSSPKKKRKVNNMTNCLGNHYCIVDKWRLLQLQSFVLREEILVSLSLICSERLATVLLSCSTADRIPTKHVEQ